MTKPACLCPICQGECELFDVVDFNKSCAEKQGVRLKLSGTPVYYVLCASCGFCFAPEFAAWDLDAFEEKIYNSGYKDVDPDYATKRAATNHANLSGLFGSVRGKIRHLDYGGGNGELSKLLCETGWDSMSYDPFVNRGVKIENLGKFDFISAFEVFEHVPDINKLMTNLRTLLAPQGIVLFSTMLSDGQIAKDRRLDWWYASPRNGHISLYSKKSLATAAKKYGFNYGTMDNLFHFMWTTLPEWAQALMGNPQKSAAKA